MGEGDGEGGREGEEGEEEDSNLKGGSQILTI